VSGNVSTLERLLAQRHSGDVFVTECKDGPSQGVSHVRLDAWAMPRSWSHPWTTGYEIKVSRSDFLKDTKWPAYLPLCNYLYFVTPPGLIKPDEVPEQCGLLVCTKNGTRLYTKKKAPLREVEVPESLFRYILMSRTQVVGSRIMGGGRKPDREYWREWLDGRHADAALGRSVSAALRDRLTKKVSEVEVENIRLQAENKIHADLAAVLESAGISPHRFGVLARVQHICAGQVEESLEVNALRYRLKRAESAAREALVALDALASGEGAA